MYQVSSSKHCRWPCATVEARELVGAGVGGTQEQEEQTLPLKAADTPQGDSRASCFVEMAETTA